ncbi:MAG: thiamine diphosphokinase [Balneolaceae bacterium]
MPQKAIILCNGFPPLKSQLLEALTDSDLFIAADGGANIAKEFQLQPDVVIGDMDSFVETGEESFPVIEDPDQETNDLEKALAYALEKNATDVIVFGATGYRLDHTLKNLSVMKQFDSRFNTLLFRDRFADIFLIQSPFSIETPLHTTISLFPLSGRVEGITTKGLKYNLNNGIMENGVRDGSSNLSIEKKIEIEFKKGDLLLFVNHKNIETT